MDLILWRHADAEDGVPDEKRKLTAKGHRQAARMAKWLDARVPEGTKVLVSPATRAQETARALGRAAVTSAAVGLSASPDTLLEAAGWPNARSPVIVVGHQPTLGLTAARLLAGCDVEWSVRKGAIVWITRKAGETELKALLPPDLA